MKKLKISAFAMAVTCLCLPVLSALDMKPDSGTIHYAQNLPEDSWVHFDKQKKFPDGVSFKINPDDMEKIKMDKRFPDDVIGKMMAESGPDKYPWLSAQDINGYKLSVGDNASIQYRLLSGGILQIFCYERGCVDFFFYSFDSSVKSLDADILQSDGSVNPKKLPGARIKLAPKTAKPVFMNLPDGTHECLVNFLAEKIQKEGALKKQAGSAAAAGGNEAKKIFR